MENWEGKSILVAEDEILNFVYINAMLDRTKIRIVHASNGLKAVEICKNESFDLILMDLKMPVMDGFIATSEIRKFNADITIIAQTSYAFMREKCIQSGFTDYISKPFNEDELISVLKLYLEK